MGSIREKIQQFVLNALRHQRKATKLSSPIVDTYPSAQRLTASEESNPQR